MLSFISNVIFHIQCYLTFLSKVIRLWRVQLGDLQALKPGDHPLNSYFPSQGYLSFLTKVIRLWRVQLGDLQALSLEITP